MKASELRKKDVVGVEKEISELQRAYFSLRMQKATNQMNKTSLLKPARRDIARAKTVLTQMQRKGAAK